MGWDHHKTKVDWKRRISISHKIKKKTADCRFRDYFYDKGSIVQLVGWPFGHAFLFFVTLGALIIGGYFVIGLPELPVNTVRQTTKYGSQT
jgi:hypothetical protein